MILYCVFTASFHISTENLSHFKLNDLFQAGKAESGHPTGTKQYSSIYTCKFPVNTFRYQDFTRALNNERDGLEGSAVTSRDHFVVSDRRSRTRE
jgi:hypothetical protein